MSETPAMPRKVEIQKCQMLIPRCGATTFTTQCGGSGAILRATDRAGKASEREDQLVVPPRAPERKGGDAHLSTIRYETRSSRCPSILSLHASSRRCHFSLLSNSAGPSWSEMR